MAQAQQQQPPVEQEFIPQYNKEQTRALIDAYNKNPHLYKGYLPAIQNHSQYHNVPFYEGDFSILEAIRQAAGGLVEGFSTLNVVKDAPDNEWTAVARSVGHLVGFAPGILSHPLSKIKSLQGLSKMLQGTKGIPLYVAHEYITPRAAKIAKTAIESGIGKKTAAFNSVTKYLVSKEARHIAEGAFNLGTASAISSWQHGVDAMVDSFFSGAVAGGVFAGIGNRINLKDPKAEMYARGLAGSLFMGLPSTVRGASTPEQVYEYLMGAYFGGTSQPYSKKKGIEFARKVEKESRKDVELAKSLDPELVKGWEKLDTAEQKWARHYTEQWAGEKKEHFGRIGYELLERMGRLKKADLDKDPKDIPEAVELGRKVYTANKKIQKEVKKEEDKLEELSRKDFILLSGDTGIQTHAEKEALKRDIYTLKTQHPRQKVIPSREPSIQNLRLSQEETTKANKQLDIAIKNLKEADIKYKGATAIDEATFTEFVMDNLRRNARNVFYSSNVIAFDKLNPDLKVASGPSRYTIQVAIDSKKPLHVFDTNYRNWFKYDYKTNKFTLTPDIPNIKKMTAMFGYFRPTKLAKQADFDAYNQSLTALDTIFKKYDRVSLKTDESKKIKEDIDKHETNEVPETIPDAGERLSGLIDTKMSSLVDKYMGPILRETITDRLQRQKELGEIEGILKSTAIEFVDPGSFYTKSREWIKKAEGKLKYPIPQDMKLKMRGWLARQNQNKSVSHIVTDGIIVELLNAKNPYTLGGTYKDIVEPSKLIEEVFHSFNKGKKEDTVFTYLDHITDGGVDYNLSNYMYSTAKHAMMMEKRLTGGTLTQPQSFYYGEAQKKFNLAITNVISKMKKKGFHPYGGVSDKDRIMFVRYHPDYKKVNLIKKKVKVGNSVYKTAKKLYGMSKPEHDAMMKSIIKYSEHLNMVPIEDTIAKKGEKSGFIQNAIEENKRAQIWMSNGIRGDKAFMLDPKNHGLKLNLTNNGNFKGYLVKDPKKLKNLLKAINTELPQHVDGAILGTNEAIDALNLDAGVPYTGSNKSFLITQNPNGTILGKYMIFKVPKSMSKMMNEYDTGDATLGKGVNFLIHSSSVKQRGNNPIGDYDIVNNKLELSNEGKIFEIHPGDFRYTTSAINDNAMIGLSPNGKKAIGVTFIKQFGTNLHPDMYGQIPEMERIQQDMYDTIHQKGFNGVDTINNLVLQYREKPSNELLDKIMDNFNDVGLETISMVLKSPGMETLGQNMLMEILKINKETVDALKYSGELSGIEGESALRESVDFVSAADNILKSVSSIKGGYPLYFDKYTRKYVNKALDRFVGQRVLTPKVKNAAMLRMRPYDKFLQKIFPELNNDALAMKKFGVKSDEIFYLGDYARDIPLFTDIKGHEQTTAGKLWDATNNRTSKFYKSNKEAIEDVFEVISVRVPQDSPSGAQVLKFAGFTGIKNHDVLLHGRTMEAEGGADLDSDESFIYFGGRKEDGSGRGQGMKKSWRDMIKAQKEEFYTADGKSIKDAKDQYRDQITITPEHMKERGINPSFLDEISNNPYAKYSPAVRMFTGQETAKSRGLMGPVVTMSSNKRQAWSSLRKSDKGHDVIQMGNYYAPGSAGKPLMVRKIYTARKPSAEQRDFTKALINFVADPANETGLIQIYEMNTALTGKYFKEHFQKFINNKWVDSSYKKGDAARLIWFEKKHERYNLVRDINSAFFGRNRVDNRQWDSFEKQKMIEDINKYPDNEKTTSMFRFAETLKGFNIDVSLFDRVNREAVLNIYSDHESKLKNANFDEKLYKKLLHRTSLREPTSKQISFVLENDLHINIDKMSKRPEETINLLEDANISLVFTKKKIYDVKKKLQVPDKLKGSKEGYDAPERVQAFLRELLSDSTDYLSNAMHNITTLDVVVDIYQKAIAAGKKISDKEFEIITDKVEDLKQMYALDYLKRKRLAEHITEDNLEEIKAAQKIRDIANKLEQVKKSIKKTTAAMKQTALEQSTRVIDQGNMDASIKKFKNSLSSEYAKDMFDSLIIGSLRSFKVQEMINYLEGRKHLTKTELALKKELYHQGTNTNTSQLGYNSKEISRKNLTKFFIAKNKYFKKASEKLTKEDLKDLEEQGKELDKINNPLEIFKVGTEINHINGYKGLVKGDLTKEQENIVSELVMHLKSFPDAQNQDLNQILAGTYAAIDPEGFPKNINQMNTNDFKLINNYFSFLKSGTFHQRMEKAIKEYDKASLKGRHHMQFPLTVNREMMAHDLKFLPDEGFFRTTDGSIGKFSQILKPTYYGEVLQNWIGKMQAESSAQNKKLTKDFRDKFQYLTQINVPGDAIWEMAVRHHELANRDASKLYEKYFKQSQEKLKWNDIKDNKYVLDIEGERKTYTVHQLKELTRQNLDKFMKKMHIIIKGEEGALDKYRTGYLDEDRTQPKLDYVSFINDLKNLYKKRESFKMDIGIEGAMHMARAMLVDLAPVEKYIGIGKGVYGKRISRFDYYKLPESKKVSFKPDKAGAVARFKKLTIKKMGQRKGYFPHHFLTNKGVKEAFKIEQEAIMKDTKMTRPQKKSALASLMARYKARTGDWDFSDYDLWYKIDKELFKEAVEEVEVVEKRRREGVTKREDLNILVGRMGAQFQRKNHQGGWIIDPAAVETYINNITSTYYRQLSNIMSRQTLFEMNEHMRKRWIKGSKKEKAEGAKLVKNWLRFWNMYAREAMGNPTIISEEIYNDPDMKIKANPYGWFADNLIAEKVNTIAEKLGLLKEDSKVADYFKDIKDVKGVDAYNMRAWSQVEAKYELATLLTHPKTPINNIFGGTMHTISSAGFEYLRKARDLKFLQTINPKWKTRADLNQFVSELGIDAEFAVHELGLQPEFRTGKGKAFVNELGNKMAEVKSVKDLGVEAALLGKKYGIAANIVKHASKFMTIPERALRRDAFMAHYIKAWERLGGAIKDPYNPILIDVGKKGVKATQFLYSAPYRPGFARSGLGKIMSRFQLWSWNAVRFRNDLYKHAKIYGFESHTDAMQKFKRTMAIDAFVYALSGIFMYSMFEQVLPAPWNWLQDTSQWLFGDETERDRAFFGTWPTAIAPLQIITPPIARLPISVIREFSDDDYTKLADYYVWTMLPFGRLLRDVAHPEKSIFDNPMRAPEKLFGVPLTGFAKEAKAIKEREDRPPIPGFKELKY